MSSYVIGVAFLAAAACSFFFALAESALFALGRFRANQMAEDHPGAGRRIAPLFENAEDLVAALALGNTMANAALIGLTAWVVAGAYASQLLAGGLAFAVILLGCEVIPKALGVRAPEFWSARVAGPVTAVLAATRPVRRIAQAFNHFLLRTLIPKSLKPQPLISENEYHELLSIAQQQGALAPAEKELILQILTLDKRTAGDVMKPRSRFACISDELSREEMLEAARKSRQMRLPVYDETPDTIVGVLNTRAFLLNPDAELDEVLEFPSFVPQSMNLLLLLRSLQRQQRGLAIVLDEFGGTAGVVTMEDVLEETIGLFRKDVRAAAPERIAPGQWRVDGACAIDEFRREFPALNAVEDIDTMSGLFVRQLEYVPAAGESVTYHGLRLTARRVDDRKVRELEVEVIKR